MKRKYLYAKFARFNEIKRNENQTSLICGYTIYI